MNLPEKVWFTKTLQSINEPFMAHSYLFILLLIALFSDTECWLAGQNHLLCHDELLA